MPTFTIHQPPPKIGERAADPERFVFVRDGFYFWAFVLAPLWLLLHRLWLALAGYIAVNVAIGTLLYSIGASDAAKFLIGFLVALLVGFEAATLWRWTLDRRGWKTLGFTVGDNQESAEQRFFSAWAGCKTDISPPEQAQANFATPIWRGRPAPSDVIGLFPEPGGRQ